MPNHVQSLLRIAGPEQAIAQLIEFVADGESVFAFEKIVPQPSCVLRGDLTSAAESSSPGRNWYAWNRRRWGTKWGAYQQRLLLRADGCVHFGYQSAWQEARPVIDELAMLFPDLRIEHFFLDEHGGGGSNGCRIYEAAIAVRLYTEDAPDDRATDVPMSNDELHVLIHGQTTEEYYGDES